MMFLDCPFAIATILLAAFRFADGHLAVMSVDLGSEYMKIAIVKSGVPMEIITNEDSARKTASIVCIRNGERHFGNPAEHCASKYPSQSFWYLTQVVGKKFEDPAIALYQKRFPYYNLVRDEERGTVLFQVDSETRYSPEELLAMILEKGRHYAETFADQPIRDAVITVPSFFNQAERRAILLAAEMGGLNVLQLMGDNAAVALNYGVFRRKEFNATMKYIMFYDMGATSTTATIVGYHLVKSKEGTRLVENPQLVIKGVGFDKELGGLEMSIRLQHHFAKYFHEHKKSKLDIFTNHKAMAKLLKEAEKMKKVLSANVEIQAQVEGLLEEEDFKMRVTRTEFEELCQDMIVRVTKPIDDALKASEITLAEVSDVILMGGCTRIPIVQNRLQAYLGGIELGKSINTDEAAAVGAVYQAAYLGKGFKVLNFWVKEANIYPIVVEFEKHKEDSTEPSKIIKRTLFGHMNPYPQKKVMTFNKHYKDFTFIVTYGELDVMPTEGAMAFHSLERQIQSISLKGVAEAYAKHGEDEECKGIKAHFRMDESGVLILDQVELVFEKEDTAVEEESAWSKLSESISGLFASSVKDDDQLLKANESAKSDQEPTATNASSSGEPEKSDKENAKTDANEVPLGGKQPLEKTDEELKANQMKQPKEESTNEKARDKVGKMEKTDEKKADKKEETKAGTGEKKMKVILVKENITSESTITDVLLPSKASLRAMRKKLADLTAKDQAKQQLEKAKNELEAYIYEKTDKLNDKVYKQCSKEEEREIIRQKLSVASDWLNEVEENTPKETYIEKLRDLKKGLKALEFKVKELNERPNAIANLSSMLNHTRHMVLFMKNASSVPASEEPMFTNVEIETLEKLVDSTEEWKVSMIKEQKGTPSYEKPKLLINDIETKIQALDREVKYLLNKVKSSKSKSKSKSAKKSKDINETVSEENAEAKESRKTETPEGEEPLTKEKPESEKTGQREIDDDDENAGTGPTEQPSDENTPRTDL